MWDECGNGDPPEILPSITDTPEIPTFALTYEWPVVMILGSGGRLDLSTPDNTDYGDAARKLKEFVEQHRSDDPPEWIECAGAWVRACYLGWIRLGPAD